MKMIRLILGLLFIASIAHAQTVTPDQRPHSSHGLLVRPQAGTLNILTAQPNNNIVIQSGGNIDIEPSATGAANFALNTNGAVTFGSNSAGAIQIKSSSSIAQTIGGTQNFVNSGSAVNFSLSNSNTAGTPRFLITPSTDGGLTAATNAIFVSFAGSGQTRTHNTGALALQTDISFSGLADAFGGASTQTTGATLRLIPKTCGANGTCTNETSLYIPATAITATNGYGLWVETTTGASNNYGAYIAGSVGIGTAAPLSSLSVTGNLAVGSYGGGASTVAAPSNGMIVSGNVGIGTAVTSASNALEVNGAVSVGYPDVAAPANGMAILGNVGIGTTTGLAAPLTLAGAAGGDKLVFTDTSTVKTWNIGGYQSNLYFNEQGVNTREVLFAGGGVGIGTSTALRNSATLDVNGSINVATSGPMLSTSTSFTNGAGASAGTLTNAPAVGNPTKWIPINDNGTTRYIPAW